MGIEVEVDIFNALSAQKYKTAEEIHWTLEQQGKSIAIRDLTRCLGRFEFCGVATSRLDSEKKTRVYGLPNEPTHYLETLDRIFQEIEAELASIS